MSSPVELLEITPSTNLARMELQTHVSRNISIIGKAAGRGAGIFPGKLIHWPIKKFEFARPCAKAFAQAAAGRGTATNGLADSNF